MTSITHPADLINGDKIAIVPIISRYRFFSLNNRNNLSGLNTTTYTKSGNMRSDITAIKPPKVTTKSYKFQPDEK